MSLHNSTKLENRMDFSNMVDLQEARKRGTCAPVTPNKFKAQRSGFEFERRSNGAREQSIRRGNLRMVCGNCSICFDEIKLERAQGECLGIRSR